MDERIARLTRCPRCHCALLSEGLRCTNPSCDYATVGFPCVGAKPVLIDFENSIVDRDELLDRSGASPIPRARGPLRRLREWAEGGSQKESARNCGLLLDACRAFNDPKVLIVGGGRRGSGTEALYAATDVQIVGTDVYASDNVDVLADGHDLPFANGSFHGVWIQAVLEHVVMPERVVGEIKRVLVKGGVVYAETPFLQPVHERAYDFSRFTRSGHRWLFREFTELASGTLGGPAESLLWSIRYLARSLFRSDKLGSLFVVAFFWLRYIDAFVNEKYRSDSATGVYFFGTSTDRSLTLRDLVRYFPGA